MTYINVILHLEDNNGKSKRLPRLHERGESLGKKKGKRRHEMGPKWFFISFAVKG